MSGVIDPRRPVDDTERIGRELAALRDRLDKLEAPSGTQAYRTVEKLSALINDIQAQLDAYMASRYTNSQIDAFVAGRAPASHTHDQGDISGTWTKDVNTGGTVRGGSGDFPSSLKSQDVYNRIVSGSGYRATWTASDGQLGYVPSSERFKQDIGSYSVPVADVAKLRVVQYRYKEAVALHGDHAPIETGLIAEEVHAAGLTWLVDYDEEGRPFGVRYELLALAIVEMAQRSEKRMAARAFKEKLSITVGALTALSSVREVAVTWDTPFADADYLVVPTLQLPTGVLTAATAREVPGTRTREGVIIRVATSGLALTGATLDVRGSHA